MRSFNPKITLEFQAVQKGLSELPLSELEQLIEELQQVVEQRKSASSNKISTATFFWALIEKIDWSKSRDEEKLKPLLTALRNTETSTIYQFAEQLAQHLHQLDGPQYYDALKGRIEGLSADAFLYARCFVVAKGEAYYKKVIQQPEMMRTAEDFEGLLYVAKEAFEEKTDESFEFTPSVVYESFFNQELWKEKAIVL